MEVVIVQTDIDRMVLNYLLKRKFRGAAAELCRAQPQFRDYDLDDIENEFSHSMLYDLEHLINEYARTDILVSEVITKKRLKATIPLSSKVKDLLKRLPNGTSTLPTPTEHKTTPQTRKRTANHQHEVLAKRARIADTDAFMNDDADTNDNVSNSDESATGQEQHQLSIDEFRYTNKELSAVVIENYFHVSIADYMNNADVADDVATELFVQNVLETVMLDPTINDIVIELVERKVASIDAADVQNNATHNPPERAPETTAQAIASAEPHLPTAPAPISPNLSFSSDISVSNLLRFHENGGGELQSDNLGYESILNHLQYNATNPPETNAANLIPNELGYQYRIGDIVDLNEATVYPRLDVFPPIQAQPASQESESASMLPPPAKPTASTEPSPAGPSYAATTPSPSQVDDCSLQTVISVVAPIASRTRAKTRPDTEAETEPASGNPEENLDEVDVIEELLQHLHSQSSWTPAQQNSLVNEELISSPKATAPAASMSSLPDQHSECAMDAFVLKTQTEQRSAEKKNSPQKHATKRLKSKPRINLKSRNYSNHNGEGFTQPYVTQFEKTAKAKKSNPTLETLNEESNSSSAANPVTSTEYLSTDQNSCKAVGNEIEAPEVNRSPAEFVNSTSSSSPKTHQDATLSSTAAAQHQEIAITSNLRDTPDQLPNLCHLELLTTTVGNKLQSVCMKKHPTPKKLPCRNEFTYVETIVLPKTCQQKLTPETVCTSMKLQCETISSLQNSSPAEQLPPENLPLEGLRKSTSPSRSANLEPKLASNQTVSTPSTPPKPPSLSQTPGKNKGDSESPNRLRRRRSKSTVKQLHSGGNSNESATDALLMTSGDRGMQRKAPSNELQCEKVTSLQKELSPVAYNGSLPQLGASDKTLSLSHECKHRSPVKSNKKTETSPKKISCLPKTLPSKEKALSLTPAKSKNLPSLFLEDTLLPASSISLSLPLSLSVPHLCPEEQTPHRDPAVAKFSIFSASKRTSTTKSMQRLTDCGHKTPVPAESVESLAETSLHSVSQFNLITPGKNLFGPDGKLLYTTPGVNCLKTPAVKTPGKLDFSMLKLHSNTKYSSVIKTPGAGLSLILKGYGGMTPCSGNLSDGYSSANSGSYYRPDEVDAAVVLRSIREELHDKSFTSSSTTPQVEHDFDNMLPAELAEDASESRHGSPAVCSTKQSLPLDQDSNTALEESLTRENEAEHSSSSSSSSSILSCSSTSSSSSSSSTSSSSSSSSSSASHASSRCASPNSAPSSPPTSSSPSTPSVPSTGSNMGSPSLHSFMRTHSTHEKALSSSPASAITESDLPLATLKKSCSLKLMDPVNIKNISPRRKSLIKEIFGSSSNSPNLLDVSKDLSPKTKKNQLRSLDGKDSHGHLMSDTSSNKKKFVDGYQQSSQTGQEHVKYQLQQKLLRTQEKLRIIEMNANAAKSKRSVQSKRRDLRRSLYFPIFERYTRWQQRHACWGYLCWVFLMAPILTRLIINKRVKSKKELIQ